MLITKDLWYQSLQPKIHTTCAENQRSMIQIITNKNPWYQCLQRSMISLFTNKDPWCYCLQPKRSMIQVRTTKDLWYQCLQSYIYNTIAYNQSSMIPVLITKDLWYQRLQPKFCGVDPFVFLNLTFGEQKIHKIVLLSCTYALWLISLKALHYLPIGRLKKTKFLIHLSNILQSVQVNITHVLIGALASNESYLPILDADLHARCHVGRLICIF